MEDSVPVIVLVIVAIAASFLFNKTYMGASSLQQVVMTKQQDWLVSILQRYVLLRTRYVLFCVASQESYNTVDLVLANLLVAVRLR